MEESNISTLKDILKEVAEKQQYNNCEIFYENIANDGSNYTSFIYRATISALDKPDLHLFVKVAAISEKMREQTPLRIFETENFFYNKLLKNFQKLEDQHKVPAEHRLVTPKMYASSDVLYAEALVLEDMAAIGYQAFDRFKPIEREYAMKSVQNLAKYHALSIAWSTVDPDEFKKVEGFRSDRNVDSIVQMIKNITMNALQVIKPEYKDRTKQFLKDKTDYSDFLKHYRPLSRPVITHGDYRPSNLLHRLGENGECDVISIDYQTLQLGNPIIDLMYFIFNGSDKEFRKHHLTDTIEHYYTELCAALRRLDLDPDEMYSREDFDYELKEVFPFGLVISMFSLLIVTVQEKDAPKVGKVDKLNDFEINPNELYIERLNDIIEDFINMELL